MINTKKWIAHNDYYTPVKDYGFIVKFYPKTKRLVVTENEDGYGRGARASISFHAEDIAEDAERIINSITGIMTI